MIEIASKVLGDEKMHLYRVGENPEASYGKPMQAGTTKINLERNTRWPYGISGIHTQQSQDLYILL